jgi:UDP-N-acetylglucosamine 2-epimerase (non-hydrolysing)
MGAVPVFRIVGVVGARPNFMKIAPIFACLDARPERFATYLVHTGQHYDERMSEVFFRELGIREPDVNLGIGSGSHADQTARVLTGVEEVLLRVRPDLLLVVGDVNSTLAAALAASKLCIPVGHVEAGLRAGDRTMPEEINRLVTDVLSEYLFTSSRDADENLRREGVEPRKIHFVGNVMIDTLLRFRDRAAGSGIYGRLGLRRGEYALLTLHRPANVDAPGPLRGILDALAVVQRRIPVVFPIHPRTEARIRELGFAGDLAAMPGLRIVPPQSYLDFLALQSGARFVLTDSGGVQEETTVLGVPCLTLRENTERPVTLEQGTSVLVGHDAERIAREAGRILDGHAAPGRIPEYWDGRAAERIAAVLERHL